MARPAKPRPAASIEAVKVRIIADGVFPEEGKRCDSGDVVTVPVEIADILEANKHARCI